MPTNADLVAAAMKYQGLPYVMGAEGDLDAGFQPVWALDCSELVQVACADLEVTVPDGHWNQWQHCLLISVDAAINTAGALLFVYDGTTAGHVAISRGDGTTIEARGRAWGVGVFDARNRTWTHGGLIPELDYQPTAATRPRSEEEKMTKILRPAGTNALFLAEMSTLPDGTLHAEHAFWLRDGERLGAFTDRGVPFLEVALDDMRNVPLIGDVPEGDVIAWTREMFAA